MFVSDLLISHKNVAFSFLSNALHAFSPGSYISRYQDFVDAGFELGEVCKSLFLKNKKHSLLFCGFIYLL